MRASDIDENVKQARGTLNGLDPFNILGYDAVTNYPGDVEVGRRYRQVIKVFMLHRHTGSFPFTLTEINQAASFLNSECEWRRSRYDSREYHKRTWNPTADINNAAALFQAPPVQAGPAALFQAPPVQSGPQPQPSATAQTPQSSTPADQTNPHPSPSRPTPTSDVNSTSSKRGLKPHRSSTTSRKRGPSPTTRRKPAHQRSKSDSSFQDDNSNPFFSPQDPKRTSKKYRRRHPFATARDPILISDDEDDKSDEDVVFLGERRTDGRYGVGLKGSDSSKAKKENKNDEDTRYDEELGATEQKGRSGT